MHSQAGAWEREKVDYEGVRKSYCAGGYAVAIAFCSQYSFTAHTECTTYVARLEYGLDDAKCKKEDNVTW